MKNSIFREFFETAQRVKQITDSYHIPLIINDRTDICLAVNAAGIHIGQQDLPAKIVRSMVGPDKIIGVSAATLSEAIQAETRRCRLSGSGRHVCYLHKKNTRPVTIERLIKSSKPCKFPVVAIRWYTVI